MTFMQRNLISRLMSLSRCQKAKFEKRRRLFRWRYVFDCYFLLKLTLFVFFAIVEHYNDLAELIFHTVFKFLNLF